MLLGFKTELKVNNTQKVLLAKHAGVARHAWNWGLSLTKNIYEFISKIGNSSNWKQDSNFKAIALKKILCKGKKFLIYEFEAKTLVI